MSTTWVRVAYGVVLGLVLLFTAVSAIALALPGPRPVQPPQITFRAIAGDDNNSAQLAGQIDQYYSDARDFRNGFVIHQRNSFLAGAGVAIVLAVVGLVLPSATNQLRWGLLVGAVLVCLWAGWVATRAVPNPAPATGSVLALLGTGEPRPLDLAGRFLQFAVSFIGLILIVFVGLWRLTEWTPADRTAASPASATEPPPAPTMQWQRPGGDGPVEPEPRPERPL